ncbi:MAG: DNA polymerase ligase N-terminal domain-containing protein [Streptosporangiaceae bacterium]
MQLHDATTLHFDLRLRFGDVLRSWAVPRGPSLGHRALLRGAAGGRPSGDAQRPARRADGPRTRGARHVLRGHA